MLEASEELQLEAPRSATATSACAPPIARAPSVQQTGREPRTCAQWHAIVAVVVVVVAVLLVAVEHEHEHEVDVSQHVETARADGRGVAARQCRGSGLAASEGTVSQAILCHL